MNRRTITIAIALLDAASGAIVVVASYNSTSDPATVGFDNAAGVIVGALFLMTGLPALVLVYLGRAPRTALILALAFPALFIALFLATVVMFTMPP